MLLPPRPAKATRSWRPKQITAVPLFRARGHVTCCPNLLAKPRQAIGRPDADSRELAVHSGRPQMRAKRRRLWRRYRIRLREGVSGGSPTAKRFPRECCGNIGNIGNMLPLWWQHRQQKPRSGLLLLPCVLPVAHRQSRSKRPKEGRGAFGRPKFAGVHEPSGDGVVHAASEGNALGFCVLGWITLQKLGPDCLSLYG